VRQCPKEGRRAKRAAGSGRRVRLKRLGSKKNARRKLSAASPAARKGTAALDGRDARRPPPRRSPAEDEPQADGGADHAHARVRSSGVVTSATYACAVEMFAAIAPASAREASSTGSERAKPKSRWRGTIRPR